VRRKLFKNLGWKLGGLVLALILWFHLTTEQQFQKEIVVDIKYINLPKNLELAPESQKLAYLRITANGKVLFRLLYLDKIELIMDLSDFSSPGRYFRKLTRDQLTIPAEMPGVRIEFVKLQTCDFDLIEKPSS
jgi:hypothetical protein